MKNEGNMTSKKHNQNIRCWAGPLVASEIDYNKYFMEVSHSPEKYHRWMLKKISTV